jgi:hypothetical protein
VLFLELQLPVNGDPTTGPAPKSLALKRGGPRRGKTKTPFSTSKDILEKLKKLHPLPGVILEWRRITNALTKTVFPLQKEKVSDFVIKYLVLHVVHLYYCLKLMVQLSRKQIGSIALVT